MLREAVTDVIRVVTQAQLGGAFAQIYTVGYQRQLTVSLIHVVNTQNLDRSLSLCAYPPGGGPSGATALLWDFIVPANDFFEFGDGLILLAGWSIAGKASAFPAINVSISGVEQ